MDQQPAQNQDIEAGPLSVSRPETIPLSTSPEEHDSQAKDGDHPDVYGPENDSFLFSHDGRRKLDENKHKDFNWLRPDARGEPSTQRPPCSFA
jgi:hypothetical protein